MKSNALASVASRAISTWDKGKQQEVLAFVLIKIGFGTTLAILRRCIMDHLL